jgi:hypothetical protein
MPGEPNRSSILSQSLPWDSLWELPARAEPASPSSPVVQTPINSREEDRNSSDLALSGDASRLAYDCITYPYDGCVEHQSRLNLSARKLEQAKAELEARGFVKAVPFGQTLFAVPTEALYGALHVQPPRLRRALSFDHSFAVMLGAHHLRQDPLVHSIDMEVPVGDSGAAVDIVARMKNGTREAVEVTLSAGNVASHAAKCRNAGFSKIVFLCRDTNIRQAAWSSLHNAGLEPELLARCRCILFSMLLKRRKAMKSM